MKPGSFFTELKRRNVYKVAVGYGVVGWLVMQVGATVVPALHLPDSLTTAVVVVVLLGFPIALVIAWAFEMTPEGMKRTENLSPNESIPQWSGRKFAGFVIVVALVAGSLLALQILRSRSPESPASPEKSIAVLPFESLSEDKNNAYFAEGIQDEILTRLSKIADLKVISRTSTQRYKSTPESLSAIGRALDVAHVLEGSVQKSGSQVRVNVQLIRAANDTHLWAETYDRQMVDLFKVESEIAQKIAGTLEAKLSGREQKEIAAVGTKNAEAYDAYLHALAYSHAQGQENEEKYAEFAWRATELDPGFMEAWAELAIAEAQRYFFPLHNPTQLARVREAAEAALRLGPDSAAAHEAMGIYYYYGLRDYDRAESELNQAIESTPNNSNYRLSLGLVQRRQGRFDEAIQSLLTASRLDPMNEDVWVNLARSYRGARQFKEARTMLERALAIEPGNTDLIAQKSETYVAEGDLQTGWEMVKDLKFPRNDRGFGQKTLLLVFQHRYDEAIAHLSAPAAMSQEMPPLFRAVSHATLGVIYREKGDAAKASSYLQQATEELKTLRMQGDDGSLLVETLIQVEAALGHRAAVEELAGSGMERGRNDRWGYATEQEAVARAYVLLGDFDRALPLLQECLAVTAAESFTPAYLRFDPIYDPIRNDPRFRKLAGTKP